MMQDFSINILDYVILYLKNYRLYCNNLRPVVAQKHKYVIEKATGSGFDPHSRKLII